MATTICHHEGKYNIYCSISDGFHWATALTIEQLEQLTEEKSGKDGLKLLKERPERAHRKGTSSHISKSLESELCINRAGKNEKHLTYQECLDTFFVFAE